MMPQTIDEVIAALDVIIETSKKDNTTFGYFAALYRKVTISVKEHIEEGAFEDGPRMEKLDVVFANRYIEAYTKFHKGEAITESWRQAFERADLYWLIVLQHLMLGMNAHINLDLGIAAVEVMDGKPMEGLHNDFNKINEVLSDLVNEVQDELSKIWPTLKIVLKFTGKFDDFFVDFSMELARDGAWKFATELAEVSASERSGFISKRDQSVAKVVRYILPKSILPNLVFRFIRLGERGTVASRIEILE